MAFIKSSRFGRLLRAVKKGFKRLTAKFSFDFWEEMTNNEIANSNQPEKAALKWYRELYLNNPDKYVKRRIMTPGTLCIFDYDTPKYKDTLDFFDTQPLVLVLTPFITKDEKIRILGINLHLLPPNIRRLVLYQSWYMFKSAYMSQLFTDKDQTQVNIRWQDIKKQLEKFGAGFAVRMYIPHLQKNAIEFNPEDWGKAAWIPSKAFYGTNAVKLEREWRTFVNNQGRKVATAGETHNGKKV